MINEQLYEQVTFFIIDVPYHRCKLATRGLINLKIYKEIYEERATTMTTWSTTKGRPKKTRTVLIKTQLRLLLM